MWRRLIILLIVLVGVLTGAAFAIKSDRVADDLRQRLEQLAWDKLGAKVTIGALHIELWPPLLRCTDVTIWLPSQTAPVTFDSGAISVRPWPGATGALVINLLELDGLHVDVNIDKLRRLVSNTSRHELRSPIDVRDLHLKNTTARIRAGSWLVSVASTDLSVSPAPGGLRQLTLDVPSASIEHGKHVDEVAAHFQAALRGGLDRLESLTITDARISHAQEVVAAAGTIGLGENSAIDLKLDGTASLTWLNEFVAALPPLGGIGRFALQLDGPLASPVVSATISVSQLELFHTGLGDLDLETRLEPGRVRIENFKLVHPRAGKLTGSGVIELGAGLALNAVVRLHEASLPMIIELAGLPNAWVDARISGDVNVHGRLAPFGLSADTSLEVDGFRVLDRSFHAPTTVEYLHFKPVTAQGKVTISTSAVVIDDVTLIRGSSRAHVEGALHYAVAQGIDLRMASDTMTMEDLGKIAFVPYSGSGAMSGTVIGPYNNPAISGVLSIDGLGAATS